MAKASKFAALAEFRQHPPEPEPEPDPVAGAAGPMSISADELEADGGVAVAIEEAPTVAEPESIDFVSPPRRTRTAKAAPPPPPPPRPRGRPPGKRSDPQWKLFSHFLKRSTQRQATAILFETEADEDLSDVLQGLLEKWVAGQRAKM